MRGPTLGEIELLNPAPPESAPLRVDVDPVVMSAGDSATLSVKITNNGSSPASGTLSGDCAGGTHRHAHGGELRPARSGCVEGRSR